jgi:DNA-directed RNA polymerase specialized sigma24 family protein
MQRIQTGDATAVRELWAAYYRRLVGLARKKLQGTPRQAADEEDVALCALDSFCRGARSGRFSWLEDRKDVWRIQAVLASREASHLAQREHGMKRGGGRVRHTSALGDGAVESGVSVVSREPDPHRSAQTAEEFRHLLHLLPDPRLRLIALCKLERLSNAAIASCLDTSERTVARKLLLIRALWSRRLSTDCA